MRYLQKNEYLLADQYTVGNKKIKNREFEPYYLQHKNHKIFWMPIRLWIYELGRRSFNRKAIEKQYKRIALSYNQKLAAANQPKVLERLRQAKKKKLEHYELLLKNGNLLMRNGEPPAIYMPQKRRLTESNLLQYLYTRGFFNARVSSGLKIKDRKAYVIYKITENRPFIVKNIILHSSDPTLAKLLQPYERKSLLKKGKRYDQDVLVAERERIYDLLVNNGYWGFNKQYIAFNVDTTADNASVTIETVISLPAGRKSHPVYHLDSIEFSVSGRNLVQPTEDTITQAGITFYNISQDFKPHVLTNKIPLQSGQLYRKRDIIEVQKRLANLGIFKDTHVSYDALDEPCLKTHIHTNLLDKFQIEQELGTKFTQSSTIPFYELSFKSRNLLKRLELITLKTELSMEVGSISTNQQKIYNEQNVHLGLEFNFPQFLVPLPASVRTRLDTYRPHTKVELSYTVGTQPNYWKQDFKTLLAYEWQPTSRTTCELVPLSIRLVDYKLFREYKKNLDEKRNEYDDPYKRYKYSLLASSAIKINFRNSGEHKKNYLYLGELFLESGGNLQNLIDFKRLFGSRITYYKYLKLSISYNRHIPVQEGTIFAYHFNTGILYPYNAKRDAPADKYYFIGGVNSIRAWGSRSLGPGSYPNKDAEKEQFFEEKAGEFILQANAEIRQQLIRFIEGAAFVDMGNIWMLHKTKRQGADFELNRFYKEIAIGTGVGVRLNLNFLVLRLDVGFRLYDPGLPVGARLFPETLVHPTINFGLGYPF